MEPADEVHETVINDVTFGMSFDYEQINYVYMDIESPIRMLKVLLRQKLRRDLSHYDIWLQNAQYLDPSKTLVDQCDNGEGVVQINFQILDSVMRLNITDVVKPLELIDVKKLDQDRIDSDIVMSETESGTKSNDSSDGKLTYISYARL